MFSVDDGEFLYRKSYTICSSNGTVTRECIVFRGKQIGSLAIGGVTMFTKDSDDVSGKWKLELYADSSHMPGEYKNGLKPWSLP